MEIFVNNLPSIDLHGYDRECARVALNDFINDNIHLKNSRILIIHGKGQGIIKQTVKETLKSSKNVLNFEILATNDGCTVATLKIKK